MRRRFECCQTVANRTQCGRQLAAVEVAAKTIVNDNVPVATAARRGRRIAGLFRITEARPRVIGYCSFHMRILRAAVL